MTTIKYPKGPHGGHASIDMDCVLLGRDGQAWICSGSPTNHGLKPMDEAEEAAMAENFGPLWRDAIAAIKALDDGA